MHANILQIYSMPARVNRGYHTRRSKQYLKASHTDTYPGQAEGAVETSSTQTIVIELSC